MSQGFDLKGSYYSYISKKTIPSVFIHGVGLDHQMWKPQINSLNEFSTLTYDLLGHGKSELKNNEVTLNDFSNQLKSLLDFLNIKKINLIGFSLGSLIALDFTLKFKEYLDTLTLMGTTYQRTDEERSKVLDRFEQAKLNKPISRQALKRWFTDKYLDENPEIYSQFMNILNKNPKDHDNFLKAYKLFANHRDDIELIKKIETKTLIMTGSDDPGSTVAMSESLSKVLVNSKFVEVKNGKHLCSIECADDVNINLKNFIYN
ncbi:alpha/beta fold hydrolase [Candidatus Pelagibacter bacterium nBUS_28]|uniref:alpha/beta fold hydrolase n=1 Tax=Candidatus Pelagibacter bacterium nBUS_28 TaxID=3374189 RepID=UPI003EB89C60